MYIFFSRREDSTVEKIMDLIENGIFPYHYELMMW